MQAVALLLMPNYRFEPRKRRIRAGRSTSPTGLDGITVHPQTTADQKAGNVPASRLRID
jgi:hypothetical protein